MSQLRQRWAAIQSRLVLVILFYVGSSNLIEFDRAVQVETQPTTCVKLGWFPTDFGLKDHTVFWYDSYYYIASNYLPSETKFAYGRSIDMCSWETLAPVLTLRINGTWDEMAVWAPFVYQEGGIYYLYYAGVTTKFTQSILLATSTDPADPASWQPRGVVFQPAHAGMNWRSGQWADCRDPTVVKVGDQYFLYYTGSDVSGGIIGVATATSPMGPWTDWGVILNSPPQSGAMYESPVVIAHDSYFYLAYNDTSLGERYRIGPSPTGPWIGPFILSPGWADEIWTGQDRRTYSSYLTDYTITISPVTWDILNTPARLWIGSEVFHIALPLLVHQDQLK